jgi:hypothetical protein
MGNDSPEDTYIEREYQAEVNRCSRSQNRPVVVTVSKDKCGIDEVDIEVLVMRRALGRIRAHTENPAVAVDLEVLNHSIDRIMKALRSSRVTEEDLQSRVMQMYSPSPARSTTPLTTQASLESTPTAQPLALTPARKSLPPMEGVKVKTSTAFDERQKINAQAQVQKRKKLLEIQSLRKRAEAGLWGSLLTVLNHADGDYKLILDPVEVTARSGSLLDEARLFGLVSLGSALTSKSQPLVTIRGVPLPPNQPPLAEDRVLPAGVIRYLMQRSLPVVPAASSKWGNFTTKSIVDWNLKPFMTANLQGSSVTIDFGGAVVRPCAYGFASIHNILPGYFPRSWSLLGSLDGVSWSVVREHTNDNAFAGRIPSCLFDIPDSDVVCRSLRIESTGPNSFGTDELQVSSFEVYGSIMLVEQLEMPILKGTQRIGRRGGFAVTVPPPDISTLIKKGKKK